MEMPGSDAERHEGLIGGIKISGPDGAEIDRGPSRERQEF